MRTLTVGQPKLVLKLARILNPATLWVTLHSDYTELC